MGDRRSHRPLRSEHDGRCRNGFLAPARAVRGAGSRARPGAAAGPGRKRAGSATPTSTPPAPIRPTLVAASTLERSSPARPAAPDPDGLRSRQEGDFPAGAVGPERRREQTQAERRRRGCRTRERGGRLRCAGRRGRCRQHSDSHPGARRRSRQTGLEVGDVPSNLDHSEAKELHQRMSSRSRIGGERAVRAVDDGDDRDAQSCRSGEPAQQTSPDGHPGESRAGSLDWRIQGRESQLAV